jgi:hypothetical protein
LQSLLDYPQENTDFIFIGRGIFVAKAVRKPAHIITLAPHKLMADLLGQQEKGSVIQGILETYLLPRESIPFS